MKVRIFLSLVLLLFGITQAKAQTTAFTYQGKLSDSGSAPNGNYDLTFQLFDTSTVGTGAQLGATLNLNSVPVSSGIFTVQLDFGACGSCFNGGNRFLEIAVRPSGGGSFIKLSPRQPISSTPYAVKSVNAVTADSLSLSCVSCVTGAQLQSVQGSQVTGAVAGGQINGTIPLASVPAGSASYIQNGTAEQALSNFNIDGDGTVGGTLSGNSVNAKGRFTLNGETILRTAEFPENLLVGIFAGGSRPGRSNTFVGFDAGSETVADPFDTENTFVGYEAGGLLSNTHAHGRGNTLLGTKTKAGDAVSNATAIGANAVVDRSDSLVLGNNVNVGIGVTAPQFKLHVIDGSNKGLRAETGSPGGTVASFGGFGEF